MTQESSKNQHNQVLGGNSKNYSLAQRTPRKVPYNISCQETDK